jgi:hypothetical protein
LKWHLAVCAFCEQAEEIEMRVVLDFLSAALLIGVGATILTDLFVLGLKWLFGFATPNYGLVGRWIGYVAKGVYRHESIAASAPLRGERVLGWTFHYAVGIAFACLLLVIWGIEWAIKPTIGPALIVGIGTVAAPFLVMQPGMGAGIAASRTPNPTIARLRSLMIHAIFGLALYAAGWAAAWLRTP